MATSSAQPPKKPVKPSAHHTTAVELMPGDVALGLAGDQLKTLLGSCVCVILTDPRRTVGVMCHIVHVGQPNAMNQGNTAYGTEAMDDMFDRLIAVGVVPQRCEAYVFGGGNMFPQLVTSRHVGASNIDWVLDFLHEHDIPVVSHCLGGTGYRKVSWTVGKTEPVVETVNSEQGTSNGR
jgi:chemotaxis protein CheD